MVRVQRPNRLTREFILIVVHTFLWLGFFIRSGFRKDAYKRYRQQKEIENLQLFPPRKEWFSPVLSVWTSIVFRLKTGHSQKWVCKVYAELMLDSIPEFTRVTDVGQVKIDGSTLHVKDAGYEFTINENGPGEIYIHQKYEPQPPYKLYSSIKNLCGLVMVPRDWELAYRADWSVGRTLFITYLEEMWKQIKQSRSLKQSQPKSAFAKPVLRPVRSESTPRPA